MRRPCAKSLQHWNHIANQQNAARQAEYQAFIHSYTPEQIKIANNARSQLRKLLADKRKHTPPYAKKLVDDRQTKKAVSPFPAFVRARHASGDYKNIPSTEAIKLAANEWKSLSAAEKQVCIKHHMPKTRTNLYRNTRMSG